MTLQAIIIIILNRKILRDSTPPLMKFPSKSWGRRFGTGPLPPTVATLIVAYGRTEQECPVLYTVMGY